MTAAGKLYTSIVLFSKQLEKLYTPREAAHLSRTLHSSILGLKPHELAMQGSRLLSEQEIFDLRQAMTRLLLTEPLQYILGKTDFLGMELSVNPSVLIPRPETAELVLRILKENKKSGLKVLDIGTGSGCIALFLAKNLPAAEVHAWDISSEALETAEANARLLNLKVHFSHRDVRLWKHFELYSFDIIVSNPPYVTESERTAMHENVIRHEPGRALFVPDDEPLLYYKTIADLARKYLLPGGQLYFEINERFGNDIQKLLETRGYRNIEIWKDIHDKDRFARAELEEVSG